VKLVAESHPPVESTNEAAMFAARAVRARQAAWRGLISCPLRWVVAPVGPSEVVSDSRRVAPARGAPRERSCQEPVRRQSGEREALAAVSLRALTLQRWKGQANPRRSLVPERPASLAESLGRPAAEAEDTRSVRHRMVAAGLYGSAPRSSWRPGVVQRGAQDRTGQPGPVWVSAPVGGP
jgi:hypothetical protein